MDKSIDFDLRHGDWDWVDSTGDPNHSQKLMNHNRVKFSRSIRLSSDGASDLYRIWGILYAEINDYPRSLLKLGKALAMDPGSAIVLEAFGKTLNGLEKYEEALIYFKKALKLNPSSFMTHKGLLQTLEGLKQGYELFYEELLKENPKSKDSSDFHFAKAEALAKSNEHIAAFASYQKAIEITPDHHFKHFRYAMALYRKFCLNEALFEFERAAALEPTYKDAHNNVAFLKYNLGQIPEAIEILEGIIENELENFITFPNMILFQYHLHQNEDVIEPYLEKFKAGLDSECSEIKRAYTEDLELTEKMLKEAFDETTRDFYLKKINSIKFMLSLLDKLKN